MTRIDLRAWLLSVLVKKLTRSWFIPLSFLLPGALLAANLPSKVYFLGNSFTWDAQPHNISTATTFPNGLEPEIGFGIYSGKSLTFIVNNPTEAVTEVGLVASDFYPDPNHTRNFEIDLPGNNWDVVSMQPHTYGGGLFLETEIAAAKTVISTARQNPNNFDTVFFVLGPWAFQEGPDKNDGRSYSENWLSGYSESQLDEGKLPNVRQAFETLFWDRLKTENPGITINWIPIGEALYKLDQELLGGAIPGLSGAWELFDEFGVHLHDTDENGIAGRYLSHITALCTIWGSHPSTFTTKYDGVIDEDFKELVDTVVWNTVQKYLPTYACLNQNLIVHPGLPDDFLKSPVYRVRAYAGPENDFKDSAVLEYATNFGDDPVLNDPFNISDTNNRDALADTSHWTSLSYGNNGNPLELEIAFASGETVTSCEVFPSRYQIPVTVKDDKAYLTLHASNRYLYLVINDNKEQPLFIFIDPLEVDPPSDGDEGVLYFGPGIHDIGKHFEFPENIHTIYLAAGAYVKGSILANGRSDISVRGRGILSGEGYGFDSEINAAVHFSGAGEGQLLEGITSIRPVKYHIRSEGILHTKNVKCLSYDNTTDGVEAGANSLTEDCFFKVNGDVIKLHNDNQTVRDLVVYHQTEGHVIGLGQNSRDSLVQRIDIVQDDTVGVEIVGQAILGWADNTNPGSEQIGHVIEDIRAKNGIKRLVHFNLNTAYGFADIKCRNWSVDQVEDVGDFLVPQPGTVKIVFENVTLGGVPVSRSDFNNTNQSSLQLSFLSLYEGAVPEINLQPVDVLAAPDQDLTLSVEAAGLGTLVYQWYKNGIPMPAATSANFALHKITTAAEAEYSVGITNPFGTTTSRAVIVTFTPREQSISFPALNPVSINEEALTVDASATSDLDVEIEVVDGPATIENGVLVFHDHGEVTVRATQIGNGIWSPAAAVEQVLTVYSQTDTWRKENLGTFENVDQAADTADPDLDLIPNLFEYFLGTSPLELNETPILSSAANQVDYNFETTQALSSIGGISVEIEVSNDLISWSPVGQNNLLTRETESGDLHYQIKTNDLVSPYFLRVKVQPL